jgi:hypothetical protein
LTLSSAIAWLRATSLCAAGSVPRRPSETTAPREGTPAASSATTW